MNKKVLALYFTQTGQLQDIVENFTIPFKENPEVDLEVVRIYPEDDYPFPWSGKRFFEAMPDSVLGNPQKLKPSEFNQPKYDLVVFAHQPWFLSPSIPATSILKNEKVKAILNDTPVVTLIGARNMWLNSQEKVKKLLQDSSAKLVGNIALIDRANNLASAVGIVYWLIGGKKERYLGIFPKPGVSDEDIQSTATYGDMVLKKLLTGDLASLQADLVRAKALEVKPNIMFIESKAGRLFMIWATFISSRPNRGAWLVVFKYYLFFALFIVSPIVLLLNIILIRPFNSKSRKAKKNYYLGLNKG